MAYPMHNVKLMYSYIQLMSLDACFDNITLNLLKAMAAPKVFKKNICWNSVSMLYIIQTFSIDDCKPCADIISALILDGALGSAKSKGMALCRAICFRYMFLAEVMDNPSSDSTASALHFISWLTCRFSVAVFSMKALLSK